MAYPPNTKAIGTKRRSDFRRTTIQSMKIALYFEFSMYLHLKIWNSYQLRMGRILLY
jgi:hypothetical protein